MDVVVVGGGIGGAGLATVLARAGLDVVVLERTTEYPDIVRGEWVAPWGVAEAKRTGLYDVLTDAGGHHLGGHVSFGEGVDPQAAVEARMDLTALVTDAPGPLCLRHPVACQALVDAAEAAGATVLRGVTDVALAPGEVSYRVDGRSDVARCRLVVGADGRGSPVRRAAGIQLHRHETSHYLGGVLLDGVDWWTADTQAIATEGGLHVLCFPQGGGRVRMYLAYPLEMRDRFAGPARAKEMLRAFGVACWPGSEQFVDAGIAGPPASYGSVDTWTPSPFVDGLVMIGDAAGYNDPIIGQGLSITLRDVRMVSELLLDGEDWSPSRFGGYATERVERMRRLRLAAQAYAIAVGGQGAGRDRGVREKVAADGVFPLLIAASMVGPDALPEQVFSEEVVSRLGLAG